MLKRTALGGFLLVAGVAMLGSARTTPFGVVLLAVGLSSLALPTTLHRPRNN